MDFNLSQAKARFLELAIKKISGTATTRERNELAALIEATPDLDHHYHEMSRELKLAEDEGFLELCLRVLFNKATSDELSHIRALKQSHAGGWRKFQELAFILESQEGSSTAPSSKRSAPTPMPEAVRKRLLTGLREKRESK